MAVEEPCIDDYAAGEPAPPEERGGEGRAAASACGEGGAGGESAAGVSAVLSEGDFGQESEDRTRNDYDEERARVHRDKAELAGSHIERGEKEQWAGEVAVHSAALSGVD